MVPLMPIRSSRDEQVIRRVARDAIDLDLNRTLPTTDDPFGRAVLLWSFMCHREQLVNLDGLVAWARSHWRTVLVEGATARKRDEAIASALLCAAALRHAGALGPAELAELRSGASPMLGREVRPGRVPFDQPAYGAAVVLACGVLELELPGGEETVLAVMGRYLEGGRIARPLGLPLLAYALAEGDRGATLQQLSERSLDALASAGVAYEARLYLVHTAWIAADVLGEQARLRVAPAVEAALEAAPVYPSLETGLSHLEADGPKGEWGRVSRLFLASLHDLATSYGRRRAELARGHIEVKYQGNRGHGWLAFAGIAFPTLFVGYVATLCAWPALLLAWGLFLRQQFAYATDAERLQAAVIPLGWSYLIVAVVAVVAISFDALVRRRVASDHYLHGRIVRGVLGWWKWWTVFLVFTVVAGIVVNLISASVQAPAGLQPSRRGEP